MLYKLHNFNSEQVEETLQLKSWWAALAILPFVRKLVLYLCNYTEISPNTITVISFVLRIISAYLFLVGKYLFLVGGAIIFELAYLLDCVDGPIARLKKRLLSLAVILTNSGFTKIYSKLVPHVLLLKLLKGISIEAITRPLLTQSCSGCRECGNDKPFDG